MLELCDNLCRICLKRENDSSNNIFDVQFDGILAIDVMNSLFNIDISSAIQYVNNEPKMICNSCQDLIKPSLKLRDLARKSHEEICNEANLLLASLVVGTNSVCDESGIADIICSSEEPGDSSQESEKDGYLNLRSRTVIKIEPTSSTSSATEASDTEKAPSSFMESEEEPSLYSASSIEKSESSSSATESEEGRALNLRSRKVQRKKAFVQSDLSTTETSETETAGTSSTESEDEWESHSNHSATNSLTDSEDMQPVLKKI